MAAACVKAEFADSSMQTELHTEDREMETIRAQFESIATQTSPPPVKQTREICTGTMTPPELVKPAEIVARPARAEKLAVHTEEKEEKAERKIEVPAKKAQDEEMLTLQQFADLKRDQAAISESESLRNPIKAPEPKVVHKVKKF